MLRTICKQYGCNPYGYTAVQVCEVCKNFSYRERSRNDGRMWLECCGNCGAERETNTRKKLFWHYQSLYKFFQQIAMSQDLMKPWTAWYDDPKFKLGAPAPTHSGCYKTGTNWLRWRDARNSPKNKYSSCGGMHADGMDIQFKTKRQMIPVIWQNLNLPRTHSNKLDWIHLHAISPKGVKFHTIGLELCMDYLEAHRGFHIKMTLTSGRKGG